MPIVPDVWIESPSYRGNLARYPVKKGLDRLLTNVRYRKKDPVVQHVAVCWKVGLPKKRDEPWFLMTDLERKVEDLTTLYGKRMTIEDLFPDDKNKCKWLVAAAHEDQEPERLDHLLLILALAYWLLVGLGTVARQHYRRGLWCSSNRQKESALSRLAGS